MDYVTADLHFGHKGILGFERSQFKTIQEHDEYLIRRINSAIKPDDVLYILGDIGFWNPKDPKYVSHCIKRIECAHKILVVGNHDRFPKEELKKMGFSVVHYGPVYYESATSHGQIILSHEPVKEASDNPYVINVHGHVHNGKLKDPHYFNVNIANTGYSPVSMRHFEKIAAKCTKKRRETFGNEWYYDLYDLKGGKERK